MKIIEIIKLYALEIILAITLLLGVFLNFLKDKQNKGIDKVITYIYKVFFALVIGEVIYLIFLNWLHNTPLAFLVGFLFGIFASDLINILDKKMDVIVDTIINIFSSKFK